MKGKIANLFILNIIRQGKKTGLTSKAERFRLATRRDWMNFQNPFQLRDSIILLFPTRIHDVTVLFGATICSYDSNLNYAQYELRDPQ